MYHKRNTRLRNFDGILLRLMNTPRITQILDQLQQTTPVEEIDVLFVVARRLIASRNHMALYPTGIVSTALYIYIMTKPSVGLYAEALLNSYYLAMSIYGWVRWQQRHESESAVAISRNTGKDWLTTASI